MKITWVTRSFLDYRIPVYRELDRLSGGELTLLYYRDVVPERVRSKIEEVLGNRAIGLSGELRLSGKKSNPLSKAKKLGVRIPWQPGLISNLRQSQPQVMISDGFFQWTYAPLWQRFWHKTSHVMCYEPTFHTERNAQWYRTIYRKLAAHWIDALCCNGSLCREYSLGLGIAENKIFIGNMAADSDNLALSATKISATQIAEFRQRRDVAGPLFLYVGRLVELKGIMPLLQAWQKVNHQATLLLAGDGPERPALEQYCRDHKLDNVRFAGEIVYDNLPLFYRAADVFIIPTLQDNWSLVVPEAMACGLPVACSQYNGCHPELVHPQNGWIFDPMDEADTVNVLQQIIAAQTQLPAMGQASRQIVAEFTPQHAAESIFNACQYALEKKK